MTSHYKVPRRVEPAGFDAQPRFVKVLKLIPPGGYVTFNHFKGVGKDCAGGNLSHACAGVILRRASPHEHILKLDTVRLWCTQINDPGFKNTTARHSVRSCIGGRLQVRRMAARPLLPAIQNGDAWQEENQAGHHRVVCERRKVAEILRRARFDSKITRLLLQPAPDFLEHCSGYLALSPTPLLVVPAAEPSFPHAPQPVAYGGVGPSHHLANAPDAPSLLQIATRQQPVPCDGISRLAD